MNNIDLTGLKKVALVGASFTRFNHAVDDIFLSLTGDKQKKVSGRRIEIEHDGGVTAYYFVSDIEDARGIEFDEYRLIELGDIVMQLELRGAKRIDRC